ncbi:MAG: DNA-deoxyinosine glycosylase [Burkholderiales bacterium]
MTRIASFAPVEGEAARVLILGSMPGVQSLAAGQYYAHPRNSFWKILAAILGVPVTAAYEERIHSLKGAGIALWDVLHSCVREGSLDADIEAGSIKANDFKDFLLRHPGIEVVCFNGATAEKCYKDHVLPTLQVWGARYVRLPSSSPAHASLSFDAKVAAWRAAICAQPGVPPTSLPPLLRRSG